jgi:hypothetical protein
MRNPADVTGGMPIAVLLQSISGVSVINPLVAFYDIHGGKREVLLFYFVPDTTRERIYLTEPYYRTFIYTYVLLVFVYTYILLALYPRIKNILKVILLIYT